MKTLGYRMKLSFQGDECPAVRRIGPDEPVFKTQAFGKFERPWFFGDEGIRAGFEQEAAFPLRADHTAHAVRGFEQSQIKVPRALPGGIRQLIGGSKTRDAAPDDDDSRDGATRVHALRASCSCPTLSFSLIRCAIILINAGWSPTVRARRNRIPAS